MPLNPFLLEYLDFMRWFQINFPELYAQCWVNIEISNFHTDRRINALNDIDDETIRKLEQVEKKYFDPFT